MEWLFYLIGYILVGSLTGFLTTRFVYRDSIVNNKNPIAPMGRRAQKYSEEELDELETKRRKKLAVEAMNTGFWCGFFWILTIPFFILLMMVGFAFKGYHHFAITPVDKNFVSDKEFRKAKAIIAKHERENRTAFERELNGD